MIPYGRQNISEEDIKAVSDVLKSDFLTQGNAVPEFENKVSHYCNVNFAFAVNSATSALHISCLALDVGPNDIVWTSAVSFVASANCALYCGASIDFVDIDANTYNMCVKSLSAKLEQASKSGKLPKVVIPVHLTGQPCEMKEIYELSKKYKFKIIEDASHAIGARYKNTKIGDCKYSDIAVFSFHPVKIITTGEGGMATTNDIKIAEKLSLYRTHGITKDESAMQNIPDGPWYYEQIKLGFNYRMTDIQAALGISQMNRLDSFIQKRYQIFDRYNEYFKDLSLIKTPWQNKDSRSSLHLYVIRVDNSKSKVDHNALFNYLRNNNIGVNIHYIPIYRHPFYSKLGFNFSDFPESEKYYSEAISIPIYPDLEEESQEFVYKLIKSQVGSS
jgi:UDP-4-amino-4,6-dideoxy-N-acetyl-beta-L-altrosamine transaminase